MRNICSCGNLRVQAHNVFLTPFAIIDTYIALLILLVITSLSNLVRRSRCLNLVFPLYHYSRLPISANHPDRGLCLRIETLIFTITLFLSLNMASENNFCRDMNTKNIVCCL